METIHVNIDTVKVMQIKHDKNFIAFMAIDNDMPIGWANLTIQFDNKLKLQDAFVLEPYRRQGVYDKLWNARHQYILDNYAGKGYMVYAYCKPMSIGQFQKHGFNEVEQLIHVQKDI